MSDEKRRKRELLEIVLAATAGDATDEQLARLSELLVGDPALAQYGVELLSQEAWLNWHGSQVQTSKLLEKLAAGVPGIADHGEGARRPKDKSPSTSDSYRHLFGNVRELVSLPRLPSYLLAASLLGIGGAGGRHGDALVASTATSRGERLVALFGSLCTRHRLCVGPRHAGAGGRERQVAERRIAQPD